MNNQMMSSAQVETVAILIEFYSILGVPGVSFDAYGFADGRFVFKVFVGGDHRRTHYIHNNGAHSIHFDKLHGAAYTWSEMLSDFQ